MKGLVEACLALNINDLIRAGLFKAPCCTPCDIQWRDSAGQLLLTVNFWRETSPVPALRVSYLIGGQDAVSVSYRIALSPTPSHFGGVKNLFWCPGLAAGGPCGRLAAKLYLVACRSEFITTDAAGGVGVFPLDGASIGGVGVDVAAELAS
jgi:hypothetical protein